MKIKRFNDIFKGDYSMNEKLFNSKNDKYTKIELTDEEYQKFINIINKK